MANDQLNHRALPITIKRGIFLLLFYAKALDTYPFTCTFETNDHCFLIQDTSDDFDWTFPKTGDTDSSNTGPESAVEGEAYAYIETNWPRQDGDVAILSGVFSSPLVNPLCLTFAYHMYGDDMGTLNVLVKDETGANIVSWSKSGNQGELWYGEVIEIQSSAGTHEITIEGIRGDGYQGNAAIDNVTITEGSCATDRIPHRCTFEINDQCFLRQETDDDFDWKLPQSGITYTTNTGPSSAMEGDSYAYIEATFANNCDVAVLSSDSLTLDDPFCLTFAYHMYGNNMGKLKLLIRDETGLDVITWYKTGNKGDEWHNLKIEIPPSVPSSLKRKIIFQGVRGDGHRSDVAIDNIILTPGTCVGSIWGSWSIWGPCSQTCGTGTRVRTRTCSIVGDVEIYCSQPDDYTQQEYCQTKECPATDNSTYQCTFEAGDSCFLSQETFDDFDWTFMQTGETETHYTGPSSAVEGSSYAYIETSSPRLCCDVAILSSHRLTMTGSFCLTFAYHMYGYHMGTVKVFVKDETGVNIVRWSKSGDQWNRWHGTGIDIPQPVTSSRKIIFEGHRDDGTKGDAAIDDITLTPGSCVEGTWGEWANWGPCSQSCGTSTPGTQMRIRPCVTIAAHVGGVYCLYPEDHKQTHDCPTISCPVDGGWGGWDSWTPCSVSCGNGTKTRYRVCDNPAPAHNGLSCVGNDTDEKQCTLSECLVDGVWATWRTWSACAFVNTDVRRSRCRRCANPISLDVSASCSGDSLQSEHCPTPDDTFKKTCRCRRRRVPVIKNITKEELATVMEETKKALTVDKTKTSLSIRKKTSAPDDRKSSAAMASVLAVVLLSVPVILIVGIDLMNIRYINVFKRKKSKTSETIGCNDKN